MNVNVTSLFAVYVVEKICVNQYLVFSGTSSPNTLTIVVGKLINVHAKITGITDAEFNLIGMLLSFFPLNELVAGRFAY